MNTSILPRGSAFSSRKGKMAEESSTTRAALQSQAPALITIAPLNLQKYHQNSDEERGVYRTLSVALNLSGNGEFYPGANSWRAYKQRSTPDANVFFFQLCLLMTECAPLLGGYHCLVDPAKRPKLYDEAVSLQAKHLMAIATASEEARRRDLVVRDHYVDLRFQYDVQYEVEKMRELARSKAKGKGKGRAKKKRGGGEPVQKRARVSQMSCSCDDWWRGLGYDIHAIDEELVWPIVDPTLDEPLEEPAGGEAEEVDEEEAEREGLESADPPYPPKVPYVGVNRVTKISLIVTEIWDAPRRNVVGLLCQFVIRDRDINPGNFIKRLLYNLEVRKETARRRQMGGRAGGGAGGGHVEMFPTYDTLYFSDHPAGNRTSLALYGKLLEQLDPGLVGRSFGGSQERYAREIDYIEEGPTHLFHALRIEVALARLLDAGADPALVMNNHAWQTAEGDGVRFPDPGRARTWKYPPGAAFYYHPTDAGLREQFFPFVDTSQDFLHRLCTGANIGRFLSEGEYEDEQDVQRALDDAFSTVQTLLETNVRVNRESILRTRLITYETTNEFVHAAAAADLIYGKLDELYPSHYPETLRDVQALVSQHGLAGWRAKLGARTGSTSLAERVDQCELFNSALAKTQSALTQRFCVLFQIEGDIDSLPISDPVKAMIRWYRGVHQTKLPHMSRDYVTWDPDLDPFGNTTIQQLGIYVHFARILQPMICVLSEGLFSCYDATLKELSFNMMVHGRHDTGKTFTAIKTLIDFSCIPGSVSEYSLSTKAADLTRKHVYDELVACDECPPWMVNKKEAAKAPDLVNKEKVKMTRGQVTQRTFEFVKLPNGDTVRWNVDNISDHKRACVYITNDVVEDKDALASRFFCITMKQSKIAASEMNGHMDSMLKGDARMWLLINHFLSMTARKAAAVGAILPKPEMGLFYDVANRVVALLKEWGVMANDQGSRSLEIIEPYVRQLVYKMAIRYAFDLPGSENFHRKFSPEHICAIQPYLYVTVSQIYWALTACASEYVNDDIGNVLRALSIESGVKFDDNDTNYNIYERDVAGRVPWRERKSDEPQPKPGDQKLVNINYMTLYGSEEQICERVAQRTDPRMSAKDVGSVLARLQNHMVKPDRCGYQDQPKETFAKWHKLGANGLKEVGEGCPPAYNADADRPANAYARTADDVPSLAEDVRLPIIDMSELRAARRLHFMPNLASKFDPKIIVTALNNATVCASTRPGKVLTGFTQATDPTRVEVIASSQVAIDARIRKIDEDNGWVRDEDGDLVFVHDGVPEYARPVSRTKGVAFNHRAAWAPEEADILTAAPLAPKADDDGDWRLRYQEGAKSMTKTREIIYDLDVESATRQHMRCGRPLDEPVRTPAWIMQRIGPAHLDVDYPLQQEAIRKRLEVSWKQRNMSKNEAEKLDKLIWEESKMTRAERNARAAALAAAQQGPQAPALPSSSIPSAMNSLRARFK